MILRIKALKHFVFLFLRRNETQIKLGEKTNESIKKFPDQTQTAAMKNRNFG